MKRSRLVAVPVSVVLSIGLLVGCSSGGDSSSSATSSSSASSEKSTSKAAAKVGDKVPGAEVADRMYAAMRKAKTMRVKGTSNNQEVSSGEVVFGANGVSTHMTIEVLGPGSELISIDNGSEVYFKSPTANLPDWTKVDANSDNPMLKAMAGTLDSMKSTMDPAQSFKIYEQAGDFTVSATDGTTTTYTGTVPMSAVIDQLGPEAAALKDQMGNEPIAVELQLDEKDRPVRVVQNMVVAGKATSAVQEYSDFGADITVKAP